MNSGRSLHHLSDGRHRFYVDAAISNDSEIVRENFPEMSNFGDIISPLIGLTYRD